MREKSLAQNRFSYIMGCAMAKKLPKGESAMLSRILVALLSFALLTMTAMAGELSVSEAVTAKGVEKQAAIAPGDKFSADVGKVYLLSTIKGAGDNVVEIKHIWYQGSTKVAEVPLKIKADSWTTFSYAVIDPSQKGEWKVEIVDAAGTVLKSLSFTIE